MDDMAKIGMARHPPVHTNVNLFTVNGWMHNSKVWMGSTTTTAGAWSIDYSSAGFASAPSVLPTAQLSDADVYDRGFASLSTAPTATSAAGYGIRGANLALLGATVRTVPDGTPIHVIAIGA